MNSRTSSLLIDLRSKFPIDWRQTDAIERRNQMKHLNLSNTNIRIFAFEDPKFKQGKCKFDQRSVYKFCWSDRRFTAIPFIFRLSQIYYDAAEAILYVVPGLCSK